MSTASPRDEAIINYLLNQREFAWQTNENSKNECIFENLGNKDDLFPLSIWILCNEYKIENNKVLILSGISMPILIDYPNELSYFSTDKFTHEAPENGTLYGKSIKEIFPKNIQNKILNYDNYNNINAAFENKVLNKE